MQMPNLIEAEIRFSGSKWKWVEKRHTHTHIYIKYTFSTRMYALAQTSKITIKIMHTGWLEALHEYGIYIPSIYVHKKAFVLYEKCACIKTSAIQKQQQQQYINLINMLKEIRSHLPWRNQAK